MSGEEPISEILGCYKIGITSSSSIALISFIQRLIMRCFDVLYDNISFLFFNAQRMLVGLKSSEAEWHVLDELAWRDSTVIDVGANIGRYTLRLSELVGAKGHVVCLEPNARVLFLGYRMARASGRANISFLNACAYETPGFAPFCEDWDAGAGVIFSTATRSRILGRASIESSSAALEAHERRFCITLDSLNLKPSLIKIDVEGAELSVLKGAELTLMEACPSLIIEDNDDVKAFLDVRGYKEFKLDGSRNVVFIHKQNKNFSGISCRLISAGFASK
jgi:FkbM family methyltransferase